MPIIWWSNIDFLSGADNAQFFNSFYLGCTKDAIIRFAYGEGNDNYEFPTGFSFSEVSGDSGDLFRIMISPAILPVFFHRGREKPQTYDFYYPSVSARQFGLGQMSIHLYFSDKIMAKEYVNYALEFDRVQSLECNVALIVLETIVFGSLCSKLYI